MKRFKTLSLLLFALVSTAFVACNTDDDSDNIDWYRNLATVKRAGQELSILLDQNNGTPVSVNVRDTILLHNAQATTDGQRVLIDYYYVETPLQDGDGADNPSATVRTICIGGVYRVLTKDLFANATPEQLDSLGNDAVNDVQAWFNSGYLNVEFSYYGSASGLVPHYINCVYTGETTSDGWLVLEFRHNARNDRREVLQGGVASFVMPLLTSKASSPSPSGYVLRYKDRYGATRTMSIPSRQSNS